MIREDEIYDDVTISLEKYCVDKIAALQSDYPGLQFLDWDSVAEVHELPDADILGPAGLGLTEEDNMWQLVMSVGVSTVNDKDISRLRKLASKVFADFRPRKIVPIYRNETATEIGWAVVQSPVIITPVSRQASRALQFIQFQALLDPRTPFKS